jgi:hypothetical protein
MQVPVVDIMREVVEAVSVSVTPYLKTIDASYTGVRYDYGHPSDLVASLAELNGTMANRFTKYPLIGLFLDIPEQRNVSQDVYSEATLSGFIAVGTEQRLKPYQRTQQTFIPIIHYIRNEFERQIMLHKRIQKPDGKLLQYNAVDRYQWGKGGLSYYENGKANVFNDYIDACEFSGLKIQIIKTC